MRIAKQIGKFVGDVVVGAITMIAIYYIMGWTLEIIGG